MPLLRLRDATATKCALSAENAASMATHYLLDRRAAANAWRLLAANRAPGKQAPARGIEARMRLLSDEELLFSKRRGVVERRRHAFVAMEDRQASRRES